MKQDGGTHRPSPARGRRLRVFGESPCGPSANRLRRAAPSSARTWRRMGQPQLPFAPVGAQLRGVNRQRGGGLEVRQPGWQGHLAALGSFGRVPQLRHSLKRCWRQGGSLQGRAGCGQLPQVCQCCSPLSPPLGLFFRAVAWPAPWACADAASNSPHCCWARRSTRRANSAGGMCVWPGDRNMSNLGASRKIFQPAATAVASCPSRINSKPSRNV